MLRSPILDSKDIEAQQEMTPVSASGVQPVAVIAPVASPAVAARSVNPYQVVPEQQVERRPQTHHCATAAKVCCAVLGVSALAIGGWLVAAHYGWVSTPWPVNHTGMTNCPDETLASMLDKISTATAYSHSNRTFASIFPAPYSGNEPLHLNDFYTDLVKMDNATWTTVDGLMTASEGLARSEAAEWLGTSGFNGKGELIEFPDVEKGFYGCKYSSTDQVSPSSPNFISERAERLNLVVFNSDTPEQNHKALVGIERRFIDEQNKRRAALENDVRLSQNRHSLFSQIRAKYVAQPEAAAVVNERARVKWG